jgi:hypothetical protein
MLPLRGTGNAKSRIATGMSFNSGVMRISVKGSPGRIEVSARGSIAQQDNRCKQKNRFKECPSFEPALNDICMSERAVERTEGAVQGFRCNPVRTYRESSFEVMFNLMLNNKLRYCED